MNVAEMGREEGGAGELCELLLTALSFLGVVFTLPFSLIVCVKVVQVRPIANCTAYQADCICLIAYEQEYERAVIFRLGRLLSGGAKGPGIFFVLPCIEEYSKVDLRTLTFDVPPQEVITHDNFNCFWLCVIARSPKQVLTKDSVTVSVDAVVYYRVQNATVSIANVYNAHHSTRLLAQVIESFASIAIAI